MPYRYARCTRSSSWWRPCANVLWQDEADEGGLEQLQQMDVETTRLRDATTALKGEEKELRLALREGASQTPIPELRASIAMLEQEKAEMTARLTKLQSGNVKPISAEDREKTNAEHRKWQRTAAARKKIRTELWKVIEGELEKDKWEETKEKLGLEF